MPSSNLTARMYFDQARDAYAQHSFNDAADLLRKAIETDPKYLEAHRYLAETYAKLGYEHRAKKAWEQLLRLTSDPAEQAEIKARMAAGIQQ